MFCPTFVNYHIVISKVIKKGVNLASFLTYFVDNNFFITCKIQSAALKITTKEKKLTKKKMIMEIVVVSFDSGRRLVISVCFFISVVVVFLSVRLCYQRIRITMPDKDMIR